MRDSGRLWERHLADSLRAAQCLGEGAVRVADMGSGAGLPGIPLAIARPEVNMVLIESKARRVAFLELAVERLGLRNVVIMATRVEDTTAQFDVCLSRAMTGAMAAWRLANPLLLPKGRLLYWAGRSWSAGEAETVKTVGASCEICSPMMFPGQGPVVMMMRPRPDPTSERGD